MFAGGFTLDAAEAVCAGDGIEPIAILDLLASLVDKSLVLVDERAAAVRYRLLETVRQYALQRLAEAGEEAAMRDRHRDAMVDLAERIAPELHGPAQREWLGCSRSGGGQSRRRVGPRHRDRRRTGTAIVRGAHLLVEAARPVRPAERAFARSLEAGRPGRLRAAGAGVWGRAYLAAWGGQHRGCACPG